MILSRRTMPKPALVPVLVSGDYNAGVLAKILCMAKHVYSDEAKVHARLQQQAMAMDFDWHHSAAAI